MIYVASPYTHKEAEVRHTRYELVRDYTAKMMQAGKPAYSPIAYCHDIAIRHKMPTDALFWEKFNTAFIRVSSEVHIFRVTGWDRSTGVAMEIKLAEQLSIPLTYSEEYPGPV
jgi:hypothetical protein